MRVCVCVGVCVGEAKAIISDFITVNSFLAQHLVKFYSKTDWSDDVLFSRTFRIIKTIIFELLSILKTILTFKDMAEELPFL